MQTLYIRLDLTSELRPEQCTGSEVVSSFKNLKQLDSAPARVTCGILTFLAIQSWTHSVNAELAKVSYIKAIDVWTVSCNIFVFLSLMQYAYAQGPVLNYFLVIRIT